MIYQEQLLTIFLYLGYLNVVLFLGISAYILIAFIYQGLLNWKHFYRKIHDIGLNKMLHNVSEQNLEIWFEDIRKRHSKLHKQNNKI